jgi:DNA modification methylase
MIYRKADIPDDLQKYFVRAEIGLEATPDAFVAEMVAVFREVRRVLRDDATLWLNLGDSYAGSWGAQSRGGPPSSTSTLEGNGHKGGGPKLKGLSGVQIAAHPKSTHTGSIRQPGLKPKDLIGIPWRVAFALQADGWYLRQDIIWSKPNPMPESVTDRCTKAHEYIFLMSKSARYHYDANAIAEPLGQTSVDRLSQTTLDSQIGSQRVPGKTNGNMKAVGRRAPGNVSHKGVTAYDQDDGEFHRTKAGLVSFAERERAKVAAGDLMGTRNRRSVWTVTTQPFSEAHFATFPPDLIEPCIKAGCPIGGTVLDPFGGAGTTGLVADRLQRHATLIELNPDYAGMAERRIRGDAGLFADINEDSAA